MTSKLSKTNNISKKSKIVMDKYKQPIYYPNELIVVKNATIENIRKKFIYSDNKELEDFCNSDASTYSFVKYKNSKNKDCAVLIVINNTEHDSKDKHYLIGLAAHEALHAAHNVLEQSGEYLTRNSCESYAYMVEWITKCIYNTIIKK